MPRALICLFLLATTCLAAETNGPGSPGATSATSATAAAVQVPAGEIWTVIHTTRGDIRCRLFPATAPGTVGNFIKLAGSKFYDGTTFWRVEPGFVIQGGDPHTRPGAHGTPGTGTAGYTIPAEVGPGNPEKHLAGTLAMARGDALDSASCQFYITLNPTPALDGRYTVFGRVVGDEDLAVVRTIRRGDRMTVEILRGP